MRSSNYLRQAKRRQSRTDVTDKIGFSGDDKAYGKDSLASLMDVSITTIERWIRAGMPIEQRGDQTHEWVFDLADVKTWHSAEFPKE